jgi:serine/threonine-protein phosphatase PP1 catalytic subunit
MKHEVEVNVDDIIKSLLDVRTGKPGRQINLPEKEILGLIRTAKAVFLQQPMLV